MATVKGQNLRIFLGNAETTPIAAALSCSLQITNNTQEYNTKDDEGAWARNYVVSTSWNVKVNGAVTLDPDRNDPASLMDRIGQMVYLRMALASGEQNSTMGATLVCGYAILSDVQITAENRRRGTYDITLTGCKNLINEVRRLRSSNGNYFNTADDHILAAPHEGA
jgi:hypothetical protein